MIRPVEWSPKLDSAKVVEIAAKMGKTITIGEADELLKAKLGSIGLYLQAELEHRISMEFV